MKGINIIEEKMRRIVLALAMICTFSLMNSLIASAAPANKPDVDDVVFSTVTDISQVVVGGWYISNTRSTSEHGSISNVFYYYIKSINGTRYYCDNYQGPKIYTNSDWDVSFFTNMIKSGALASINYSGMHSLSYSVGTGEDANTITATCDQSHCGGAHSAALTLIADSIDHSGSAVKASFANGQEKAWKRVGGYVPEITYVGTGTTDYPESKTAPADCGTYKARITAGSMTAEKEFEIRHVFDQEKAESQYQTSAATCSTGAHYYKSCICGAKGTEIFIYGEPEGQVFDQEIASIKYLKSAATCTAKAVYYRSCVCGAKGTDADTFEYGKMEPHVFYRQAVEAEYFKSAATCTEKAVYYRSCSRCGAKGTDADTFEVGEMEPHVIECEKVDEMYLKTEATCTAKAVYYKSCSVCGAKGTDADTFDYGDVTEHTYDQTKAADEYLKAEATCTAKAIYYKSCSCGEKGTDTFESGSALGHKWDAGKETTAATETKEGVKTYTCTVCKQTKTEKIPKKEITKAYRNKKIRKKTISVPASEIVNGAKVTYTSLGNDAFYKTVRKVVLPATITRIEKGAFKGDQKLKTIKINSVAMTIEKGAFTGVKKAVRKKIKVIVSKNMAKADYNKLHKALVKEGLSKKNIVRK